MDNYDAIVVDACCKPPQVLGQVFRRKISVAFRDFLEKIFPSLAADLVWKEDTCYVGIDGLNCSPGRTGRHCCSPVIFPLFPVFTLQVTALPGVVS